MTKIGVVLSSGGGRGVFAHTGFMAALRELDIQVSASCGCSAGAIVGGILASGSDVADWTSAITRVRTDDFWTPRSLWHFLYGFGLRRGRGISGISETGAAVRFLSKNLMVGTYQECVYPFSSVAMNLGTGDSKIFHAGPLALGIMASAAIPGFYDPIEIDGRYFTDGAIIDLAPADAICCRYHLDILLVHHTAQYDNSADELDSAFDEPWTMVKILQRLVFRERPWYATGQPRSIHPCPCGCKAIIVVLEPKLPELAWPLTNSAAHVLDVARMHTVSQLRPILAMLRTDPHSLL